MSDVFIVNQEDLQAFTRPGLDLTTGQIVELEPGPVQLVLPFDLLYPTAPCIVQTDVCVAELAAEYKVLKDEEEIA